MTQTLDWQALSAALDHALELGTEARGQWLDELTANEPLLAGRVRSLLGNWTRMAQCGFLEGQVHAAFTQSAVPALIGSRVGPYLIEAEAGRGGMGSVWRARRDDGHFEGVVAIKFLNLAGLDPRGERRFHREGLLLGKLDHPNVARLLDAGVQRETSQPYLVMEYVDGMPIDAYCEQRGLDLGGRVLLFIDVLHAVAHAHSHLVIHGDIKPSNILVTRAGVVKLLDFGIARLADDEGSQTRSNVSALTPQYAAPEQVLGEFVTTRTDIYCLGLVLYRLLSGRHAIQIPERGSRPLLAEILERDPPAPSDVNECPTVRRQELAGDLDNIVAKAIRKIPAGRYQSAGALQDDLQRYLSHQPVTARRDTLPYRVGKFVRRHRGSVASAMLAALGLIVATVITTHQMFEARRQRDAALLQGRRADATADFLQLVLAENRPLGKPITADELLDRGADLLEMQYGDERAFVAQMYMLLAGERGGRNEYVKSRRLLELASLSARQAGDVDLQMRAECTLAFNEAGEGLQDAARKRLARTGWSRTASGPGWETEVQCLRAEANMTPNDAAGRSDALALLERARLRIESAGMTHDRTYTSVISYLAVIHRARGELPQALELVQLGGRIHEQNGRGGTRSRLLALNNEGVILWDMGEIKNSHAIRIRLKDRLATLEPRGTDSFNTNLAVSLIRLEQYDAARASLVAVAEHAHERGDVLNEIGAKLRELALLQRTEAPREQIAAAFTVLEALMNQPGRNIPNDQRFDFAEAAARRALADRDFVAAEALMTAARAEAESRDAKRFVFRSLRMSAQIGMLSGAPEGALEFARRGRAIAETFARSADSSADVGELLFLEGRAAAALKSQDSRALLQRAVRCFINGYGPEHSQTRAAQAALAGAVS